MDSVRKIVAFLGPLWDFHVEGVIKELGGQDRQKPCSNIGKMASRGAPMLRKFLEAPPNKPGTPRLALPKTTDL